MSAPKASNFIEWWSCDGEGDLIGGINGHNLTERNSVSRVAGLIGKSNYARDFEEANAENFVGGDDDWNSIGDNPLTLGGWIKAESWQDQYLNDSTFDVRHMAVINKMRAKNDHAFLLGFEQTRPYFGVSDGDHSVEQAASGASGVLSVGSIYFLLGWHDPDANQIGVRVYNTDGDVETESTESWSDGLGKESTDAEMTIGAVYEGPDDYRCYFDGVMDELFMYAGIFTSAEEEWMVNGGNGRVLLELFGGNAIMLGANF